MLKYSIATATTAIVNIILVSTATVQLADAATVSNSSNSPIDRTQLIAKGEKSAHINSQQQSDVQEIHQVLTNFYGGLNELNVDRMVRAAVPASSAEKNYLRRAFARLKAAGVDVSIEVKSIDLMSLSAHNAVLKVDQYVRAKGPHKAVSGEQSTTIALIKYQGKWKVSDGDTIVKSLNHDR